MKTYGSIDDAWHGMCKEVLRGDRLESRDGDCSEIIGAGFKLTSLDHTFCARRGASLMYANAELLWYLSGEREIDRIVAYAPQYIRFSNPARVDDDGEYDPRGDLRDIAHGAYGHRWQRVSEQGYTQLAHVIRTLSKNPNSRQAVLACWCADDDIYHAESRTRNDIPCTMTLKFYIRDRKLHLVADMRSNDLWLGMPYDVYCFTALQRLIADALNVGYGTYTHTVGSLHAYDRNLEKLVAQMDASCEKVTTIWNPHTNASLDIKHAVRAEHDARVHKSFNNPCPEGTMLHAAVNTVLEKWK